MFIPQNEQGLVSLFCTMAKDIEWNIVSVGTRFPDAILEKDAMVYRVEFEYKASNFITHGHDHTKCDIIICWINNLGNYHIPILSLNDNVWSSEIGPGEKYVKRVNPLCKSTDFTGNRSDTSNRVQLTAWGNEDYKAMLDEIVKKKGYRSMSEAILWCIAKAHDGLSVSDSNHSGHDDIYKVMIALANKEIEANMDSIHAFLEGGSS